MSDAPATCSVEVWANGDPCAAPAAYRGRRVCKRGHVGAWEAICRRCVRLGAQDALCITCAELGTPSIASITLERITANDQTQERAGDAG